jgi:alanine dehydrogenase
LAIPETAQELLLDGVPNTPSLVTLNVSVQPKDATVRIFLSDDDRRQILCKGLQKQITIECRSGRIFVEKCGNAHTLKSRS